MGLDLTSQVDDRDRQRSWMRGLSQHRMIWPEKRICGGERAECGRRLTIEGERGSIDPIEEEKKRRKKRESMQLGCATNGWRGIPVVPIFVDGCPIPAEEMMFGFVF